MYYSKSNYYKCRQLHVLHVRVDLVQWPESLPTHLDPKCRLLLPSDPPLLRSCFFRLILHLPTQLHLHTIQMPSYTCCAFLHSSYEFSYAFLQLFFLPTAPTYSYCASLQHLLTVTVPSYSSYIQLLCLPTAPTYSYFSFLQLLLTVSVSSYSTYLQLMCLPTADFLEMLFFILD